MNKENSSNTSANTPVQTKVKTARLSWLQKCALAGVCVALLMATGACQSRRSEAMTSLDRAVSIANSTIWKYANYDDWRNHGTIDPQNRFNIETGRTQYGSYNAFEYTQIIEMLLTGMKAMNSIRNQPGSDPKWNELFDHYGDILWSAFDNLEYYKGYGVWTSTTRVDHRWERVVGVPRRGDRNYAERSVGGRLTVYDDQMWLIRALLEAYMLLDGHPGHETEARRQWYFDYAVYLTLFTLDGYDHSWRPDESGQWGGVWWGPYYVTKHTCSNGPFISPLVWLYEIFSQSGRDVRINTLLEQHGVFSNELNAYVWPGRRPGEGSLTELLYPSENVYASAFFLDYAKRIYDFSMNYFRRPDGVFGDMRGGVNVANNSSAHGGLRTQLAGRNEGGLGYLVMIAWTYNTGSVLSGAVDLYRVTGNERYRYEAVCMANAAFDFFATPVEVTNENLPTYGQILYQFPQGRNGKADFDSVLLRSWVELVLYGIYPEAHYFVNEFGRTLNHAYDHFIRDGFLPVDHHNGWNPNLISTGDRHMDVADDVRIAALRTFNYSAQFSWISLSQFVQEGVIRDFSRFQK